MDLFIYICKFEKNIDTISMVEIVEWCMKNLAGFEF